MVAVPMESPVMLPSDSDVDAIHAQLAELSTESASPPQSHTPSRTTRTVAIIKPHALQHRFDIERKIQDAGFEIVKERQMEFDVETDPDTLYELFGDDADSFSEGPVWVYVLERRRAVEVWLNLMGDSDPDIARRDAPNSIRALYGISHAQNGILGSSDRETAEIQIASLFASSPPFPPTELPDDPYGTVNSVSSSVLSALRNGASEGSVTSGSRKSGSNKLFTARPLPATHLQPDIVPRTTKAAALRAGTTQGKQVGSMGYLPNSSARSAISKERHKATFQNVPGHKRTESIQVASTAAPTIAPRMTKAAALRQGIKLEPTSLKRAASASSPSKPIPKPATNGDVTRGSFEGVPGHKRRDTITVASTAAPAIAPRMSKAAALRQGAKPPPTSFMFRGNTEPKPTGRSNSRNSNRPSSQASVRYTGHTLSRTTSTASSVSGTNESQNSSNEAAASKRVVPRPSSIGVPTIAPRTNKSAALRAAKKAEEEEAARKAAERARKASRRQTVAVTSRAIAA